MNFKKLLKGIVGGIVGFTVGVVVGIPIGLLSAAIVAGPPILGALIFGSALSNPVVFALVGAGGAIGTTIFGAFTAARCAYACYHLGFKEGFKLASQFRGGLSAFNADVRARVQVYENGYAPVLEFPPNINGKEKLKINNDIYQIGKSNFERKLGPDPDVQPLSNIEKEEFLKIALPLELIELTKYDEFFKDKCSITLESFDELNYNPERKDEIPYDGPVTIEKTRRVGDQLETVYTHTFKQSALAEYLERKNNNPINRDNLSDDNIKIYRGYPRHIVAFINNVRQKLRGLQPNENVVSLNIEVKSSDVKENPVSSSDLIKGRVASEVKVREVPANDSKINASDAQPARAFFDRRASTPPSANPPNPQQNNSVRKKSR